MAGLFFDIFAQDKTGRAFEAVKGKVDGLNKQFDAVGKTISAFKTLLAGAFLASYFSGIAVAADRVNDLSNRFKISSEVLSSYNLVASEVGLETESIAKALQMLGKNSVEAASGTGAAREAFNQLGIDAAKFKELGLDQQFQVVAERMQGITNPAERVNIAMAVMGKSGAEMLQAMELGGDGLQKMRDEADRLGITLSQTQARDIGGMMDALGRLSLTFKGIGQDLLGLLAPAIELVANLLTESLLFAVNMVKDAFEGLRSSFDAVITWIVNRFGDLLNIVVQGKELLANLPGDIGAAYAAEAEQLKTQVAALQNYSAAINTAAETQANHNEALKSTADLYERVKGSMPTAKQMQENNQLLNDAKRIYEETRTPLERYTAEMEKLQQLSSKKLIDPDTLVRAQSKSFEDLKKNIAGTGKTSDDISRQMENTWKDAALQVGDDWMNSMINIGDGMKGLQQTAQNVLNSITNTLMKGLINSAFAGASQPTLPWLQGAGGGGGGGLSGLFSSATSFLGSTFGGFFAEGGTLMPGQWGIAGENGAEPIFAGSSPLTVFPNGGGKSASSSEGNNIQVTYHIDARGAAPGVENAIMAALKKMDGSIESRAVLAVANAKRRNPNVF